VQEIRKACPYWQDFDLVFPSTIGTPLERGNVTREFKQVLKPAGLPYIRFHDLRHTAASIMQNNDTPILLVSRRLGHSKPSITLDIYGHIMEHSQKDIGDRIDELIAPVEVKL
jgi:integrase